MRVKKNMNVIHEKLNAKHLDSIVSQAAISNRTEEAAKRENRLTVWVL